MTLTPFESKKIVLGITGSIAAYKGAELASRLSQAGASVATILTDSGSKMVSALTFAAVTGQKAYTNADLWSEKEYVPHIFLAHQADLFLIAPATANVIAKLANGIADDLLTVTALAFGNGSSDRPLVIAPAMDGGMYLNEATQSNLQVLRQRGAIIVGPEAGHLASGLKAKGRMTEPLDIFNRLRYLLSRNGALKGREILVTAGGTREPIDPVRVISNRSSGKQGYALAQACLDHGADVTLVTAPTSLAAPFGASLVCASTADQMGDEVLKSCEQADALIMAAAISDFTVGEASTEKIKRKQGKVKLELVPTEDILKQVATERAKTHHPRVVIGFAAETSELIKHAEEKMVAKDLDMIVANDVSSPESGFEVDQNKVTLLMRDGSREDCPIMSKAEVAEIIVNRVIGLLSKQVQK